MTCVRQLNRSERQIFGEMASRWGESPADFDAPEEYLSYDRDRFVCVTAAPPDRCVGSRELFNRAVPLAERNPAFWNFMRSRGIEIPWVSDDESLRNWVQQNSTSDPEALFQAMIRPREEGGLGLQFDRLEAGPLKNADQVYQTGLANCVEFVSFFLMAADQVGIPAEPLELLRDASGAPKEHVRIGLRNPSSGAIETVIDLENGYIGPPLTGELWVPQSRTDFLSYYILSRGVREGRVQDVELAARMNPRNYLILYNLAAFRYRAGRIGDAKRYVGQSLAIYPDYLPAREGLRTILGK